MKLFEYVVYDEGDEQTKGKVVVDVTQVLAETPEQVKVVAARSIPAEYEDRVTELVILVRVFCRRSDEG